MPDQVLIKGRVTGEYCGAVLIIDSVTVGREVFAAVIHFESADSDPVPIKPNSFFNFGGGEFHAVARIVSASHPNIDRKSQRQMLHHLLGPCRAPDVQWLVP